MPKCIILVGPPGSGKSTWAKKLQEPQYGFMSISSDAIIEDIALAYGLTYSDSFQDLIGFSSKVFWKKLTDALKINADIIIDRTNMSKSTRKKIIDIVKKYNYDNYDIGAVVFYLPADVDKRAKRLNRPGKNIPESVISNMLSNFEMPTKDEGFDTIHVINDEDGCMYEDGYFNK